MWLRKSNQQARSVARQLEHDPGFLVACSFSRLGEAVETTHYPESAYLSNLFRGIRYEVMNHVTDRRSRAILSFMDRQKPWRD